MQTTLLDIQGILHSKFSGHYLILRTPEEIYKYVDFIFARQKLKLYVSVKFPMSSFQKAMSVFKVFLSFPIPINSTSNHATQLLDLPEVFAITSDFQFYTALKMDDFNLCKS